MKSKRGVNLIAGNVVFIILNVVFLAIIIIFLISKMGNASVMEEKYAKQIALSLDNAKPEMMISINMKDAFDAARKNLGEKNLNQSVQINGNLVTVKLQDGKGYTYSFFNNINISNSYIDGKNNEYIIYTGGYK